MFQQMEIGGKRSSKAGAPFCQPCTGAGDKCDCRKVVFWRARNGFALLAPSTIAGSRQLEHILFLIRMWWLIQRKEKIRKTQFIIVAYTPLNLLSITVLKMTPCTVGTVLLPARA